MSPHAGTEDQCRDLTQREQEHSAELQAVRQALIAGERSGESEAFEFAAFIDRKRARNAN